MILEAFLTFVSYLAYKVFSNFVVFVIFISFYSFLFQFYFILVLHVKLSENETLSLQLAEIKSFFQFYSS